MTAHADRGPWAGVDVGGRVKGFHAAVLDPTGSVCPPRRLADEAEALEWLTAHRPRAIAVDSPRAPAPAGETSRPEERRFLRDRICHLRLTPDLAALRRNRAYYGWILNGFALYSALDAEGERAGWRVHECFPTATWTRLAGRRGTRSRAAWSKEALASLDLEGLPSRMNQDERDAIGAAHTARLAELGRCKRYGPLVVPEA
jgi:hypothetical protein